MRRSWRLLGPSWASHMSPGGLRRLPGRFWEVILRATSGGQARGPRNFKIRFVALRSPVALMLGSACARLLRTARRERKSVQACTKNGGTKYQKRTTRKNENGSKNVASWTQDGSHNGFPVCSFTPEALAVAWWPHGRPKHSVQIVLEGLEGHSEPPCGNEGPPGNVRVTSK